MTRSGFESPIRMMLMPSSFTCWCKPIEIPKPCDRILYEKRQFLSVHSKALLALATHKLGQVDQTNMLRRNIEQFLVEDAENETAYLEDQSPWWFWYGSRVEATANYLKLLSHIDAKHRTAPRLV